MRKLFIVCLSLFLVTVSVVLILWGMVNLRAYAKIYPNTSVDGVDLSYLTIEEAQKKLIDKKNYDGINIEIIFRSEKVATFSSELLKIQKDYNSKIKQAYLVGRSSHIPSRFAQQLNGVLNIQKYNFQSDLIYERSELDNFLEYMRFNYNKEPQDALFEFKDNKVISFAPDKPGVKIQEEEFLQSFDKTVNLIKSNKQNYEVTLTQKNIPPQKTLSQANSFGIKELIGEGKSNFKGSIPSRIHNIKLASSKFHGVIIAPNETFSFNKIIGEITSRTGYQPAYIISNGRTILGDGGGVCQVSTTLFRSALNSGLPITARTAHGYRVSYYENNSDPGFDATIFSPSVDLKFENNTNASILIQLTLDESSKDMSFKFYGQKDGRKISISPVSVWGITAAPAPLYQDDPTLGIGVVKQVDWSATGAKARFEYKVIAANGDIIQDTAFVSNYRPWRAVYLVGTKGV